jgi:hypothetical protein
VSQKPPSGSQIGPSQQLAAAHQLVGAEAASARFHVRCSFAAPLFSGPLGRLV